MISFIPHNYAVCRGFVHPSLSPDAMTLYGSFKLHHRGGVFDPIHASSRVGPGLATSNQRLKDFFSDVAVSWATILS
jgi:hypothetical protein